MVALAHIAHALNQEEWTWLLDCDALWEEAASMLVRDPEGDEAAVVAALKLVYALLELQPS